MPVMTGGVSTMTTEKSIVVLAEPSLAVTLSAMTSPREVSDGGNVLPVCAATAVPLRRHT